MVEPIGLKLIPHNRPTECCKICTEIFHIDNLRSGTDHDLSIGDTWEKQKLGCIGVNIAENTFIFTKP